LHYRIRKASLFSGAFLFTVYLTMQRILLLLILLLGLLSTAQELTGSQLLEKAIAYHDPQGNWSQFIGKFQVTMTIPNRSDRVSELEINLPAQFFELFATRDSLLTAYTISKEEVSVTKLNLKDKKEFDEVTNKDNDRAIMMRDYYTYLYGLPMKLQDAGTIINEKVQRKLFKGKEYLVLEVSYDPSVGSDVWFFYFDPETYKMEVYQFYKTDENGSIESDSGEYILLSENKVVNNINIPAIRKWYYNKNDQFLGTDAITR